MLSLIKILWYKYQLKKGISHYYETGITTNSAYSALRKMFVFSRGSSNDKISNQINQKFGKYDLVTSNGILGNLSKIEIEKMAAVMKRDGFYIFENKLSEEMINELCAAALSIPCNYLDIDTNSYSSEKVLFNPDNPISPRYEFDNTSIINLPAIQKLIFDQTLLLFAQEYLGTKPILDLIALWWSIPFDGRGKSAAAQMYHFDMDRIKFMKFFFYLTDVDTNTGPHCFVKGSHVILPKSLARDGRFSDSEIENYYGSDNAIEICGKRGSIIAVDTRGFHKGKELMAGKRLIFQIEFSNSMFGQTYPLIKIDYCKSDFKAISEKFAHTYKQLFI